MPTRVRRRNPGRAAGMAVRAVTAGTPPPAAAIASLSIGMRDGPGPSSPEGPVPPPAGSGGRGVGRRPAVAAAALFVAGVAAHRVLPAVPVAWLPCLAALLAAGWLLARRPAWCSALLAVATGLSGVLSAQLYAF